MRLEGLDPEPEDGELGYTAPLEGGRTGLEDLYSELGPVPGQVTMEEVLEERDPPIDRAAELGLTAEELAREKRMLWGE